LYQQGIKYLTTTQNTTIMNAITKQKVKEHLATEYGQEMIQIHGLKYIKKEIFHAQKAFTLGDKRKIQN
jgi:hypothetical protein